MLPMLSAGAMSLLTQNAMANSQTSNPNGDDSQASNMSPWTAGLIGGALGLGAGLLFGGGSGSASGYPMGYPTGYPMPQPGYIDPSVYMAQSANPMCSPIMMGLSQLWQGLSASESRLDQLSRYLASSQQCRPPVMNPCPMPPQMPCYPQFPPVNQCPPQQIPVPVPYPQPYPVPVPVAVNRPVPFPVPCPQPYPVPVPGPTQVICLPRFPMPCPPSGPIYHTMAQGFVNGNAFQRMT